MYGLKSVSMFTKPLGVIISGHLALKHSVQNLLSVTLGLLRTLVIGYVPWFNQIDIYAPLLLVAIRSCQGILQLGSII